MAAGVLGERADRSAGDLPGPHRAAGNREGADEARRRRGRLATLACTAAVFGLSTGPEKGWLSAITLGSGLVAPAAFVAFAVVERTAENPIVPFSLFFDRNRLATFTATFLTGGVTFTMAVLIALYVQTIMGYGPMRAAIGFIPFAIARPSGWARPRGW